MYLTQCLHRLVRNTPDGIATVDGRRVRCWAELVDRIARLAGALQGLGLLPGERVALLARNGDHTLECLFATFWAGGVINPVNLRWTAAEIGYSLQDCDTRILIIDGAFLPLLDEIRNVAPCVHHVIQLSGDARADLTGYELAIATAPSTADAWRHGDDLAGIFYTGGTTGRPKGVMLTHRSMLASAMSYAGAGESAPGACYMHTAPLFHIGGISGLLASLVRGARHVFTPAFDPPIVMAAIAANGVTDIFLVPTMLHAMLEHDAFAQHDLSSLQRIVYGASPMPAALMDRALAALPEIGFVQAYGMTELSPIASLLSPSDHCAAARANGRVRSAGQATMAAEIRIVDTADVELPVGGIGEIVVRGEIVMAGYWKLPDQTALAVRKGWMHTGDIGRMDADGYVYVVDRIKDMIITGGENVYSAEVENVLSTHPAIAHCAVIGLPHRLWGEAVHAVIVARTAVAVDEIAEHCRSRLSAYKCPRGFTFVDSLPLSGAGKVLKNELRARLVAAAPSSS